jgi:hypothetical protein
MDTYPWFTDFYTDFLFIVKLHGVTPESISVMMTALFARITGTDTALLASMFDTMFRGASCELDNKERNRIAESYNASAALFQEEFANEYEEDGADVPTLERRNEGEDTNSLGEEADSFNPPIKWGECPRQKAEPDTNS